MSGWILSVVSVVLLMVMLDLFMSEGETKKYIKGIMSIIIIAVIIAPLPKLLKKDYTIYDVFQNELNEQNTPIEPDDDFLFRFYISRYKEKELAIQKGLSELGIKGCVVRISIAYNENGVIDITNVLISLENTVITGINKNININEMIYDSVQSALNVSREIIIIYGKEL